MRRKNTKKILGVGRGSILGLHEVRIWKVDVHIKGTPRIPNELQISTNRTAATAFLTKLPGLPQGNKLFAVAEEAAGEINQNLATP